MTKDAQTITVYDERAAEYSVMVDQGKPNPALMRFIEHLPRGARVLDLGCGPGRHAAFMQAAGLSVTAMDASSAMVEMARKVPGIEVRHAAFSDLDDIARFDGVWANFSLLHSPHGEFPLHLARIANALVSGGLFHIGMKTGSGEHRDRLGRLYTYYTATELRGSLTAADFRILHTGTGEGAGLSGEVSPWIEILSRLA